ncbi:MAG TPA: CRISPR-associated helicase Cas3' [Oscillatoriaceae cyanobacterium M33_DOE_052]|uniref:CRISPR-associated helicase Cas3 n=1 Tax=Planktothricoides sp. SpSt-374 TaxID=2282167 RepID=A0A7C3VKF0_9CYAN|nr:CRISPR-associated helicase Cas3' [Oscillatoriaceae cyanobacterium M33_DOE_052]
MSKKTKPYIFGRVFFPGQPNPIPSEVLFQPLGNHVGNVMQLVKQWKLDEFPGSNHDEQEESRQRVLLAAKIHDAGKPQKFEIQAEPKQGQFREYIYSFRGHRFLAKISDAWVQSLARGHHDFSVADITRDAYKLKKQQQEYADILTKDPLAYARELYILEMCDQIEAELACRIIGDDQQAESRTFMDYTIIPHESEPGCYRIAPWPFDRDNIELEFTSWSMRLSDSDQAKLQQCQQKCQQEEQGAELGKQLDEIAKKWWQSRQEEKPVARKAKIMPFPPLAYVNESKTCQFWYQQLAGFSPNPMQEQVFDAISKNKNPAILLKAPTGSGKQEAILFAALAANYRLFLPLPARSLLEDQKQRVENYLKKFSQLYPNQEVSLVVDTGSQMRRWVYRNGEEIQLGINPRRHLYKGNVILTTLDKFLYRYFGFGDSHKSFIFPLRIHQEKTLICFDEAHSYDGISFTNFSSLVQALYEAGKSLVLMTATMPPEQATRFPYLEMIDFIDDAAQVKKLRQFQQATLQQRYLNQKAFAWLSHITLADFKSELAKIILDEWQQAKGKRRIIAVVETVKDAAPIYKLVKEKLGIDGDTKDKFLFLYHGRIADQLRPEIYQKLQKRDQDNLPYLLVTTSAIEVGCDLNCDVLISQICPPENLIQRAGRCNRKGNISDAKVIVVGDAIPDFVKTLDESEWRQYQNTLQSMSDFQAEKIQSCISRSQQIDDYRVVELFAMLSDYVYQADLTCQPLHQKGLIPTRSWVPSVNLEFHGEEVHSISVPLDRLYQGQEYAHTYVYETRYDKEHSRWNAEHPLWSGIAYGKEITVKIYPENNAALVDASLPLYDYDAELGFVELPRIFIKKWSDGSEEKMLRLENSGKSKIIVSYIKPLSQISDMLKS